jgi:hypothetical protein
MRPGVAGTGRAGRLFPVPSPTLRVAQLVIRGVDLSHPPGSAPLDDLIAARDVRVVLTRKTSPRRLDGVRGGVERQLENREWVAWRHPISLPGRTR